MDDLKRKRIIKNDLGLRWPYYGMYSKSLVIFKTIYSLEQHIKVMRDIMNYSKLTDG